MVAAGLGVAIVPRLTIDETNSATAVIPLEGVVPPRQIALVWHEDQVPLGGVPRVHGDRGRGLRRVRTRQLPAA